MRKYIRFNILDLPHDEFSVVLENEVQRKIIESAASKVSEREDGWGRYKNLAFHLKRECKSFENIKVESIQDNYISNWKFHRSFILIDCFLALCKLAEIRPKHIEKYVLKVKYKLSPNHAAINFPKVYDEDLAFFGEAIRVEGHISKSLRRVDFSNRNVKFTNIVSSIAEKYVSKQQIYKLFKCEVDIPRNEDILEVRDSKDNLMSYYTYDKKPKKKLYIHDKIDSDWRYKIKTSKRVINIEFKIIGDELVGKSSYKYAGACICLNIANMTLARILNELLEIPRGKKSALIYIPDCLKQSPVSVKISAVNAVLASESWEEIKARRVRILVISKQYLIDLREIFIELGIGAYLEKFKLCLAISGNKDLKLLSEIFDPVLEHKNRKIFEIISTYKRMPYRHNEGLVKILTALRNKKLDVYYLAKELNRHKDTVQLHLNKGISRNLIFRDISVHPYVYSLPPASGKFMEVNM